MKTKKYYLILAVVIGILCVPALAGIEASQPSNKPAWVASANQVLAGIEELYVVIAAPYASPNEGGLVWKELNAKVEHKLEKAAVKVAFVTDVPDMASPIPPSVSLKLPELRVDIDMLKFDHSQEYVFHIQTSLARTVYLAKDSSWSLKADVWKMGRAMQTIPFESMPATVTNIVLGQVEAFIPAYLAANPPGVQPTEGKTNDTVSVTAQKEVAKPVGKPALAEYKYVASKNSKVFHQPDCPSAKRIAPKNLVGFDGRSEAVETGRRPCKQCRP